MTRVASTAAFEREARVPYAHLCDRLRAESDGAVQIVGLALLVDRRPCLVVLDLQMPGMLGTEMY
jgi:CheY-like chemotaxis protein